MKLGKLQKLDNKGIDGVMVGYEKECEAGIYIMMNLKTGMINITRDIKWMNMSYDEYKKTQTIPEREESTNSTTTETSSNREKQETKSDTIANEIAELEENMKNNTESADSEKLMEKSEEGSEIQGVLTRAQRRKH